CDTVKRPGRGKPWGGKFREGTVPSPRDIAFTPDNKRMLVSVGSASNVGQDMGAPPAGVAEGPLGASWGDETDRAAVLAFDPDGKNRKLYATGIRNCVGLAMQPD